MNITNLGKRIYCIRTDTLLSAFKYVFFKLNLYSEGR